jgi:hypothetical protein
MNQCYKQIFFFFLLGIGICFSRANPTIKDIQVGTEIKKTRVVFVLNRPVPLYIESPEDGSLLVRAPEDTFWKIPDQMKIGRGAISGYELVGFGVRRTCRLVLEPYTRLVGSFLRKNTYIVDLITDDPPLPDPEPEAETEEEEVETLAEPPPPPTVNIQQTLEFPKNEINALTIIPKEDNTTWIIINSDKQDFFESQIIPETKKLHLYLPKINWPSMKTQVLNSGGVEAYTVDESSPSTSTVIMDLKEESALIDIFSTPNLDGTYDFILILANRRATENEIKKLAEKRVELKGIIGSNKAISFKINPPQIVSDQNLGGVTEEASIPVNQNDNKKNFDQKEKEDPLFEKDVFVEEEQEPTWVSEAKLRVKEK